jgi:hypothetical protein
VETGNRISFLICPFHIALQDDPLEHVRKAKRLMGRKKNSLEVMLTQVVGDFLVKYLSVKVYFLLAPLLISLSKLSKVLASVEVKLR